MAGLKQLRNRIKSIKSTQKLTKAMQMVSSSKLKKIKDYLSDSSHYLDVLTDIMASLPSSDILQDLSPLEQKFFNNNAEDKSHLLIIMTSERGLCGSFNSAIIRKAIAELSELIKAGKAVKIIIIGKKGLDIIKHKYANYIESSFPLSKAGNGVMIEMLKKKIVRMVENNEVGKVSIFFNKFKNALSQTPTKQQIIPAMQSEGAQVDHNYNYEGEGLILNMINLYIGGQLNYTLLQSRASEEGARMTAMDNATKNAGDIVDQLTLKMNRSRQAIITKELTEIIAGAEAV